MAFASWIRSWKRSVERRWTLYQTLRRKAVARRKVSRPRLEALEARFLLSNYTVTSTADDGSTGTLRDAITQANMTGSTITEIDFNIGTPGSAQTISLTSQLPALTASGVLINGPSQEGSSHTTQLITLDGTNAGSSSDGLLLLGSGNIVSGLIIQHFNNGIEVDASTNTIGGTATGAGNIISGNTTDGVLIGNGASGVAVQGNYIGTDITGTTAVANSIGIEVSASGNVLGGTASGAGNLISGNTNRGVYIDSGVSGVAVQGNYIGTDLTGTVGVSNNLGLYVLGSGNTIGGTTASAANLISGNNDGVFILDGSGNQVQGNLIGTDVTGAKAVGNGMGVVVEAFNDTIGGTATGAGNIISGNKNIGVLLNGGAFSIAVQGNYIGTDVTGTIALANSVGINDTGADNNTIGGTVSAARNVISANTSDGVYLDGSSGVVVQGNYIGTDVSGSKALGNSIGIYALGSSNSIGGPSTSARNVISGNSNDGVRIASATLQLQGNFIGTDATGANALGNGNGVEEVSSNNIIGGTAAGAGNVISGNSHDGVLIDSGASGVSVQGNYIGTDSTGAKAVANSVGVSVLGTNGTIGGTATGARNIISGNTNQGVLLGAVGTQLQGNYIGTDATGSTAVANSRGVEVQSSNTTIGGTATGAGNVISGNTNQGVYVNSAQVQVQGNYIGTDVTGSKAIANSIGIQTAPPNITIGGTVAGAGNVISGNSSDGVYLTGASGVLVQGNYIGTDRTGSTAVGNSVGVEVDVSQDVIGGTSAAARNVISGNSSAGVLIDSGITGVQVQGNYIGTDVTGSKAVGNSIGVSDLAASTTIGGTSATALNVISGNSADGVLVGSSSSGIQVLGNYIGTDATGSNAVGNSVGIEVSASGNVIGGTASGVGNVVSGNKSDGVLIDSGVSGVAVQGNYIGINSAGSAALANSGNGVEVDGINNTIGGTSSGARNVISANTAVGVYVFSGVSGVQVQGNYIGTDVTGAKAVANNIGVYVSGADDTIGGTTSGALNVISGNSSDGVFLDSSTSGMAVQGNYIGTDVTGAKALANGVGIQDAGNNNTLGGSVKGAGNIISGNSGDGVLLDSTATADTIEGNYIGLGYKGQPVIANGNNGVEVQGSNNLIGGNSGSNYYVRNFISGNTGDGLLIANGATGNQVLGNFIGLGVSGTNAVGNGIGVEIAGNSNTVGGTSALGTNFISGNKNDGILLDSTASSNLIQGTDVGTDYAGQAPVANGGNGIEVMGNGNTLGSTTTAARNVISGNSGDGVKIDSGVSGTLIQGNLIGLNAINALGPNAGNGINIAGTNNTIGGTATSARNYIAGNSGDGVLLESSASGNAVLGNYLGVNLFSSAAANSNGIEVAGTQNTIGGSASGAFNVISGNKNDGVLLDSSASGNVVLGNSVGLNVYGTVAVGNSIGIEVAGNNNTVGASYAVAPNVISGNSKDGVLIDSGASGNQVLGNYIGTNYAGKVALANQVGIEDAGSSNTLGGSISGARNLISGNSGDGILLDSTATGENVQGNYIGLNYNGKTALANGSNGIEVQGTTVIGGDSGLNYLTRNYLSGNGKDGLLIDGSGSGNLVQGNFIGVDVSGTNGVGNAANGVEIAGTNNTIGGTSGARNVISGNTNDGVKIDSGASGNLVLGNYIGVNTYDTAALGNSIGIEITGGHNTIGASYAVAPNVISGNTSDGVLLNNSYGNEGDVVLGNYIGTNHAGTTAISNKIGIEDGGLGNTIGGSVLGARNIISGNTGDGVLIDLLATGETMQGNYIGLNVSGNTALANGGNGVEIKGAVTTVGGNSTANYFVRNFISGNGGDGILIDTSGASNGSNRVQGNFIGVGVSGTNGVGNLANGIEISGSTPNTIGGTSSGFRNVISGNGNDGVLLDSKAILVLIQGNLVGTDYTGTSAVGNVGNGVTIVGNNNTLGGSVAAAGNTIAHNGGDGVLVSVGVGNTITSNSIFANAALGIALSNGGNNNVAAPNLLTATLVGSTLTVTGSFTAPTANVSYVLQFFANLSGDPEGKIYLGSLTVKPATTGTQAFTFTTTTTVTGTYPLITATLTDNTGDTTAFSSGVTTT